MDRRSFLRELVATAVATQIPALPKVEAEEVIDKAVTQFSGLLVNGKQPHSVTVTPAMNGWYRIVAQFSANVKEDGWGLTWFA